MLESKSIHVSKMRYSSYMSTKRLKSPTSRVFVQQLIFFNNKKHQSSALLAHFWGIYRPVDHPYKGSKRVSSCPYHDIFGSFHGLLCAYFWMWNYDVIMSACSRDTPSFPVTAEQYHQKGNFKRPATATRHLILVRNGQEGEEKEEEDDEGGLTSLGKWRPVIRRTA